MGLTDPSGGSGYVQGENLPPSDMSVIALQQPKALDGSTGTDLAVTTDNTIAIINGTTYRATGTMTVDTDILLPMSGNSIAERVWIRFDCDCAGFTLTVKETLGNDVASATGAGVIDEGLEVYWDPNDSHWYCGDWTTNVTVQQ